MTSLYYIINVILFGIYYCCLYLYFIPECIWEVTRFRSFSFFFFSFKACWGAVTRHLHTEKERFVGENGKTPALPVYNQINAQTKHQSVWSQLQTLVLV